MDELPCQSVPEIKNNIYPTVLSQKAKLFDYMVQLCCEYEQNGNKLNSSTEYKGEKLWSWCLSQQTRMRGKHGSKLTNDERNKLKRISYFDNLCECRKTVYLIGVSK